MLRRGSPNIIGSNRKWSDSIPEVDILGEPKVLEAQRRYQNTQEGVP